MDIVADAYYGTIKSQQLVEDTRERIDWLLEVIRPGAVLDIGCSQGILAILLAKRGDTRITAVDILEAAIVDATQRLEKEPPAVQQAVQFAKVNFLEDDVAPYQGQFDTVVIGQVLEHVSDPGAFVARAVSCLSPNGQIIITVPYGVWDHDEHEETFFVHDLFALLTSRVAVTQIEQVGGRLAMVGVLRDTSSSTDTAGRFAPADLIALERDFFIRKERRLLARNATLQARNTVLKERDAALQESNTALKARNAVLKERNVALQERVRKKQPSPHEVFFSNIAKKAETLSRQRYAIEKERARATPARKLLRPLHWLRLKLGLRLAQSYAHEMQQSLDLDAAVKSYHLGPKQARFHRKDIDAFFSQSVQDFLSYCEALSGKDTQSSFESVTAAIQKLAPEPVASLALLQIYQAQGALDEARDICRRLLDGSAGKLTNGKKRIVHREPAARLLATDLLPERKTDPEFLAGGRIGYVVHNSLPYVTVGYATRTQGFADGMRRSGHDLIAITRPGFPLNVDRSLSADDVPLNEEIDGVPYRRILEPLDRKTLPYDYIKLSADQLEKTFREEGIQTVITASNYVCALPAIIAARRLGLPCVYEVRGFWEISAKSRDPEFGDTADFKTRVAMETLAARAADKVLTLTTGMRDELMRRGVEPSRIALAPNGFRPTMLEQETDPEALRAQLDIPQDCPVIGYVGSITPYEGLEDLATACVGLHRRGLDFRLLIVGNEKSQEGRPAVITEQITSAFAEAGISDKLIMTGRVPFEDVPGYYSIVDIAPIPRKPFEVSEIVSPIKPLEAMAFETALVVSSVAALTEIVTDQVTGYVFTKGDVTALQDVLARAITDPDGRRRIAAAGKRFALEERAWETIASNSAAFLFETGHG